MRFFVCTAVATLTGLLTVPAEAGFDYGFYGATNRNAAHVAIGESQLGLSVSDAGSGLVRFDLTNSGPLASSITDVYFDDYFRDLFVTDIFDIDDSSGTTFHRYANPINLPGGLSHDFIAHDDTSLESSSVARGVNPGESLGVLLQLAGNTVFDDVIDALASTRLKVGVQLKGFDDWGKESFINVPSGTGGSQPPAVPEPSAMALAGLAIVGLVARRRRQSSDSDV